MKDLVEEDQELELAAEEAELDAASLEKAAEEAPIIKLVNLILTDSVKRGASDIHIEPYETEMRVRFRVDGQLQTVMTPPMRLKDAITSRLKIMAKLDIAEKRLPQDGRIMIKYKADGKKKELDFRVSTVPTLYGEKIVMRLLDKENLRLDMTKLGFEQASLDKFERNILKPYGMVLVTGPTGSGKTNTLYSSVATLNKVDTNIMTAEDPVEFQLAGINQVQMKEQIGLNFAAALRAFLRQDPNIILVGEIRDFETAEIARESGAHRPLGALHAAHQRCAFDHQPLDEHGHRALSRGHFGELDLRAAAGPAHLLELQGRAGSPGAGVDRCRIHAGRGEDDEDLPRQGLHHVQQGRLQGAHGFVRSDGSQRRVARIDSSGRFGARVQEESRGVGHDHAAAQRFDRRLPRA